jgi:prevent-host-death family protein
MKRASVAEVKANLTAYLKASADGPVVVTKNGKAVAVLYGVKDEEELHSLLMGHSPQLQAILAKSRGQIARGEGIPHEEFWAELMPPKAGKGRTKRKPG